MSQDDKRAGWLSRVFGGEEPREGVTTAPDAPQALNVVELLEAEIAQWRDAYSVLAEEHRRAVEQLAARAGDATKLAALADAKRGLEQRVNALDAEVEAGKSALVKAREELAAARAEITKERARTASAQTSHRQAVLAHEATAKRAQEARSSIDGERAELAAALRVEKSARDTERAKLTQELVALRGRAESAERERSAAQRGLDEERRARDEHERCRALSEGALRALLLLSTDALDRTLGRGAHVAVRAATLPARTEGRATLAEAASALERALQGTRWIRARAVEETPAGARLVLTADDALCAASRALLERQASDWLSARVGRIVTVSVASPIGAPPIETGAA
jgi:hypothetical protein